MLKVRHPADGRVHFSELRKMSSSPAHYRHACEHAREMTRPMTVGAIADCIVFGNRGYAVYPGKVRNGKEWDAFRVANPDKILAIQSEVDDAMGAAEAVLADPQARDLMAGCRFQDVIQWEAHGLECAAGIRGERGGIDCLHVGDRREIDLKVTSCTEPEELGKHAWRMLWHAQRAFYADGIEQVFGFRPREQWIVAAEAQAPHVVTCMRVPDDVLEAGRKSIALWAEKLRACDRSGVFPGYVQGPVEMQVPSWEQGE